MRKKLLATGYAFFLLTIIASFLFPTLTNAQAFRGLVFGDLELNGQNTGTLIYQIEEIDPGTSATGSFSITHDFDNDNQPIQIAPRAVNFTQGETAGSPVYLDPQELPETARLSEWIVFEDPTIVIPERGGKARVNFTINVPEDADPGSKFAAILLSKQEVGDPAPQDQAGVGATTSISGETGPLMLLTVSGDIDKDIQLNDVYTTDVRDNNRWFFFNPPVNLIVDFKNDGNAYTAPRGRVFLHRGEEYNESLASWDLNPVEDGYRDFVLPGTSRDFKFTWNESFIKTEKDGNEYSTVYDWDNLSKLRIGKYTYTVLYDFVDEAGATVNQPVQQVSFWVVPLPLIIIVLTLFVLVAVFVAIKVYATKNKRNSKEKNE